MSQQNSKVLKIGDPEFSTVNNNKYEIFTVKNTTVSKMQKVQDPMSKWYFRRIGGIIGNGPKFRWSEFDNGPKHRIFSLWSFKDWFW